MRRPPSPQPMKTLILGDQRGADYPGSPAFSETVR